MNDVESVLEEIAMNLDERRSEITGLRRVVLSHIDTSLEKIAIRMAIPMLYALWEGFVKATCQLYIEYVESSGIKIKDLKADLLGHLWTPHLRTIIGGIDFVKKKTIASLALTCMDDPVVFQQAEKSVSTRSNLFYHVLKDIADHLCLDISRLMPLEKHLNSLVHIRNNIAHGERPDVLGIDFLEEQASLVLTLMEAFELCLSEAIQTNCFCTKALSRRAT